VVIEANNNGGAGRAVRFPHLKNRRRGLAKGQLLESAMAVLPDRSLNAALLLLRSLRASDEERWARGVLLACHVSECVGLILPDAGTLPALLARGRCL